MLFGLLGRQKTTTTSPGGLKPARRARLELEPLEGRLVPAAIRNLPGFLVNNLPANDDNTTGAVNIGFNINFFGVNATQCFVSNNGIITLQMPNPTYTPNGLTTPQAEPIIAPYWADVDTRGNSSVLTYGTDTLCGHAVFGVDWVHVNYFDATPGGGHVNKYDDFQLILINRSDTGAGNFDIEYNYNSITWETGDASGGTNGLGGQSAHAGYSNGSGTPGTFAELPGSGINGAFLNGGPDALNAHLLNATTPGRYHFFVRNGLVTQALDVSKGLEITNLVDTFHPFRYVYNPSDHTYRGNLTVVEKPPVPGANVNACLDEVSQIQTTLSGRFQVTVVYQNLPPGVTLLTPTGYTARGKPYISAGVVNFGPGLAVRFPVRFSNPRRVPLSTFMIGPTVRVFAGPFNPANE